MSTSLPTSPSSRPTTPPPPPTTNTTTMHHPSEAPTAMASPPRWNISCVWEALKNFLEKELLVSAEVVFQAKISWLLVLGPLAVFGDSTGLFGQPLCFALAGIALIPCAERLSFITEQVAEHTNGTIGALLNATFGNAPELLISVAALRAGYYRIVQLAMLGSMLSNMILIFGISCFIGGIRWQVQELRTASGNVNVLMLLLGTAGSLLPAVLKLSGQMQHPANEPDGSTVLTEQDIQFSRVNAFVMFFLYLCFLFFQIRTHKEEYDDNQLLESRAKHARRNLVCMSMFYNFKRNLGFPDNANNAISIRSTTVNQNETNLGSNHDEAVDEEMPLMNVKSPSQSTPTKDTKINTLAVDDEFRGDSDSEGSTIWNDEVVTEDEILPVATMQKRRRRGHHQDTTHSVSVEIPSVLPSSNITEFTRAKSKNSDRGDAAEPSDEGDAVTGSLPTGSGTNNANNPDSQDLSNASREGPLISLRVGIAWLFVITMCIGTLSDILVDTIDDFSKRVHLSEVFTSMVIIPFFSNVAEQVSAFIFAYRNEMDLCVGVTVGSAIQIANFVLPGSVIIGFFLDKPMTLFFRGYETAVLFFSVLVLAAVLQGGTTNWMTGATLVGIYIMLASGIWFHDLEQLTAPVNVIEDGQLGGVNHNQTRW